MAFAEKVFVLLLYRIVWPLIPDVYKPMILRGTVIFFLGLVAYVALGIAYQEYRRLNKGGN